MASSHNTAVYIQGCHCGNISFHELLSGLSTILHGSVEDRAPADARVSHPRRGCGSSYTHCRSSPHQPDSYYMLFVVTHAGAGRDR